MTGNFISLLVTSGRVSLCEREFVDIGTWRVARERLLVKGCSGHPLVLPLDGAMDGDAIPACLWGADEIVARTLVCHRLS